MKKLFAVLLCVICISALLAVLVCAEDGLTYTFAEDKKSYILSSYTKNEPEAVIKSEHNGLPVSAVASGAFSGNVSTYKIIIPESVKTIEAGAFSSMPSLYEFEAKGSYTAVDGVLFTSDKKTLVRYPEAREGEYKIPKSVTVSAYAFAGCRISDVDASGMVKAEKYAFYAAEIKNITLSSSLTYIGEHAFEKSGIEKISVPGKASVYAYAFASCEKLVYANISNASVKGEGVFYSDTSLLAVSFPQAQTAIPELTFAGCTSLVTAPVGKAVKTVGAKAFYGCVSLEYASYGSAACAADAFGLCDKLTPDKKTFASLGQKNADVTLKVGEKYGFSIKTGFDLYTVSHNVSISNNTITALYEGKAEVYAVSHRGGDCAVITVNVSDGAALIESDHPYTKGTHKYMYTVPGEPDRIAITFSSSDMLSSADAVKIQDKKGDLYGTFYGGSLAGKTLFIDGDTVLVTLISITSGNYGFRLTSAQPVSDLTAVQKITLTDAVTLKPGEKLKLAPEITPAEAFPAELLYVISDKTVASVSGDGTVCAVNEGTTELTVYSEFYGVSAKCIVTVKAEQKGDFEYTVKDGGVYITAYNGEPGAVNVPAKIDGKEVRGIEEKAFAYCGITEISIPDTVSYISPYAFDGNSALTAITVSDKNAYFKTVKGSLYSKDKKTLYRVPCGIKGEFSVPDGVKTVADGAFSCCFGLEKLVLGLSVSELSGSAFINCTSLKNVSSQSENYDVIDGVLYTADKKTLVYFPAGLNISAYSVITEAEKIGPQAFNSAVNLKNLVLPSSVNDIDKTAFSEALYLYGISVNSANAVYSVTDGVLYEGGDLKFVPKNMTGIVTVKDGTAKILPYAFYNCAYVTQAELPYSLKEVCEYSFGNCASLDSLYLPAAVQSVGADAFYNDHGISVYIPGSAALTRLSDCTVLCGKDTAVSRFCEQNGVPYKYTYFTEYGLYKLYTPVNAQLAVKEETDPILLAKYKVAAAQNIKAFSVHLLSDGIRLPAAEYAIFRTNTQSKRYFYDSGELCEIKQDAISVYRRYSEHIIELSGGGSNPALLIKTLPGKLEYKIYDEIDSGGLTLYYTDERGITAVIDNGYEITCDLRSMGEKTATVKYNGLSVNFKVTVNDLGLSGTVRISGSTRYGGTACADVSEVLPPNTKFNYLWYVDGKPVLGAIDDVYKPTAADIGKTLSVRVTSASGINGELMSEAVVIRKAASPAPPKPAVESADITTVTLKAVEGCEYRLSQNGEFTDSNVFTGLSPGETYVFYQRYKETETTEASEISSASYVMQKDYKISSEKYFINKASGAASLIDPGTTVKTLLEGLENSDHISVIKDGKKLSDEDTVGTGCEITITVDGKVYDKCVIVMTGDVNGDGKITITDYLKIKERIQSGTALSKEKEFASDVNGDGKVTITDYLRLKYCIQNSVKPEQNRY
ncbi:MAG: leucine-rich repeat protein [Clostridia bacterium]|nr:leucine-rich repeat protein [Clostridia bacterium]